MQLLPSCLMYSFPLAYTNETPFLSLVTGTSKVCQESCASFLLGPFALCSTTVTHPELFSSRLQSLQMPRGSVGAGQGSAGNKTDMVNHGFLLQLHTSRIHEPVQQPRHTDRGLLCGVLFQKETLKGSNRACWFHAVEFSSPRSLLCLSK